MILFRDIEKFEIPDRLPVLPLRDVVLFPYVVMPLLIGRPGSLAAIEAAEREGDEYVLLVAQRSAETSDPAPADLYRTGTVARVSQLSKLQGGTIRVLLESIARVRVTRFAHAQDYLRASLVPAPWSTDDAESREREAVLSRQVLSSFEEYVSLHRRIPQEVVVVAQAAQSEERMACVVSAHLAVRHEVRQRLLEAPQLADLLSGVRDALATEIDLLGLERKIDDDVRGSMFRNQREFYLQEQLKAIHRELGQEDADDLDELQEAIASAQFPDPVRARADRELRKLRRTSPISPEATVGRNYLDWLVALPWAKRTDDVLDVAHARRVLDEDHYGLEDIKDRILDYIAVLGLVGRLDGPILCLVGPPGVGKTSLGKSIARALGRRFVRMSLGGVRDEAEIRGHRRTYIGAMPGRIVQAMRRAETVNPVLLLDEVDKLGHDWRGDPSAALLEVLDPEQNRAFSDHYLEVDYDLSHVLFLTTANSLAAIPDPLRDRMEILRLAGYLDHEKQAIARNFLIPRQLERHGVPPASVQFEADAVPAIVREYTREAGVRELERRIARVARKLARARSESASVAPPAGTTPPGATTAVVRAADLRTLLGVAPFDPDEKTRDDRVGVANGLAYTAAGGEILEIEVGAAPGRGRLQLTGTLGDVMKESASAALSYLRGRARLLGLDADFHRTRDVHVHIPAGATPKDGPSAGIAIAAAMASALSGVPIRGNVAMTGEITLRGRVLGIGGLKEKSVAALRSGIHEVLIPEANLREIDELPEDVRSRVRFHVVTTMDDVLRLALVTPATHAGVTVTPELTAH
ncbi:MAG: Lon protease [Gemmatimonadaceae bacterium]|nr:Lon protease [Gemmatimonadaceae bacterium]